MSGGDSRLQSNVIIGVFHQVLSLLINMVSKYAVRTYLGVEYLGLQTVFEISATFHICLYGDRTAL